MVYFHFENLENITIPSSTAAWLESIILAEGKKSGEINYILCNDEYLLKINRDYLQHDYYTDIITFDYVKGKTVSGDIFVSLPRISENASAHFNSFDSELHRVLAHGILHLCGYKDKTDEELALMRSREDFYLALR